MGLTAKKMAVTLWYQMIMTTAMISRQAVMMPGKYPSQNLRVHHQGCFCFSSPVSNCSTQEVSACAYACACASACVLQAALRQGTSEL